MNKLIITILLICASNWATAQNTLIQDFKGLIKQINTLENIAYEGEYRFYDTPDATQPVEKLPFKYIKSKGKIYMMMGDNEFIMIGKKAVAIDHSQKVFRVQNDIKIPALFSFNQFDYITEQEGFKAEKFAAANGNTGIKFTNSKYSKSVIEIIYRHDINMITASKMAVNMNTEIDENPLNNKRIEANFYNHKLKDIHFDYAFSDFFTQKGNKITGVKSCKGYTIY